VTERPPKSDKLPPGSPTPAEYRRKRQAPKDAADLPERTVEEVKEWLRNQGVLTKDEDVP
jgi:hypothetical protein